MRVRGRIPVLLDVDIHCNDEIYRGTALNVSKNGMLIKTDYKECPLEHVFAIFLHSEDELCVSGKLIRTEQIRNYFQGIGVALVDPPIEYIEFIDNLNTSS